MVAKRHLRLSLALMIIGGALIIGTIVTGTSLILALTNGIRFHTFNDVRAAALRLVLDLALPLAAGVLMIVAGFEMLEQSIDVVARTHMARSAVRMHKQKSRMINSLLEPDEKRVLEAIRQNNNVALQSDIVALTGYSKVKVHRLLKRLEVKELIKRSRFGITNKVFINETTS